MGAQVTALYLFIVSAWISFAPAGGRVKAVVPAAQTKTRITTRSGVRARKEPRSNSDLLGTLQLGSVVKELERSAEKERIGQVEDYWYRVSPPDQKEGGS
jgi:hypothetical protein